LGEKCDNLHLTFIDCLSHGDMKNGRIIACKDDKRPHKIAF